MIAHKNSMKTTPKRAKKSVQNGDLKLQLPSIIRSTIFQWLSEQKQTTGSRPNASIGLQMVGVVLRYPN